MKKVMYRFFLFIFFTLVILTGIISYLLVASIDKKPAVHAVAEVDAKSMSIAKSTIDRIGRIVYDLEQPAVLHITAKELNDMLALGHLLMPFMSGQLNMTNSGLLIIVSFRLPDNPLGRYINLSMRINPSHQGLDINSLDIGKLSLPGNIVLNVLRITLDVFLGNKLGTKLVGEINAVVLSEERVAVYISPKTSINKKIKKAIKHLEGLRDEAALFSNPEEVRSYYKHLIALSDGIKKNQQTSLAYYTQRLFKEAQNKSKNSSAQEQNTAVIFALGIYLGNSGFEKFVGKVRTQEMKAFRPPDKVALSGRGDLLLHFIYSAVLEVLSNKEISYGVGEFKELLDSNRGGSGFSFVDLGADRAGVRLAHKLISDNEDAIRLQKILSESSDESVFFPYFLDLPEGLSEQEFKARYGSVDDIRYKAMVKKIDLRLDKLNIYRKKL